MPLNDGAINDILLFAPNGTEEADDLLSLESYLAHVQRLRGHQQGMALRQLENRVLRQTSLMAAGVAQFIANRYAAGVLDNADVDAVEGGLVASIDALIAAGIASIDIPEVDLSGYARLAGTLNLYLNSQRSTPLPVDYSATVTLDFSARCHFDIAALTGDLFLAAPTNLAGGQSGYIHLLQDAIGGRAISYGSVWFCPDGAQSLTAAGGGKDTLVYYVKAADRIIYNLIKGV